MRLSFCLPKIHFGFCSDGHLGQILGIAAIIKAIQPELDAIKGDYVIWIVIPLTRHALVRECLRSFVPLSKLHLMDAELRSQDRYYVQTNLSRIFSRANAQDYVICMDYDHVVIKSFFDLFSKCPSFVFVSSEVRSTWHTSVKPLFKRDSMMQALNTSLIWGRADHLQRIGEIWTDCYFEVEPFIPKRNLVEYAFGLAALRGDVKVLPCSLRLQGNMYNMNTNCPIFHYGGDSDLSLFMKSELYRRGNACTEATDLACAIEEIDSFMVECLLRMRPNGLRQKQQGKETMVKS